MMKTVVHWVLTWLLAHQGNIEWLYVLFLVDVMLIGVFHFDNSNNSGLFTVVHGIQNVWLVGV